MAFAVPALFHCPLAVAAAQLSLTPLALTLGAGQRATSLTVGNNGSEPVTLEAELLNWSQADGCEHMDISRELLVSPPLFTLAPGARQLLRVGRAEAGAAPALERAFRLRLTETPPADPLDRGQISTLLRLTLPVFMSPADRKALPALHFAPARRDGNDLLLDVKNHGSAHGKLIGLQLLQDGRLLAEHTLNWYVLAGAERELRWPAALRAATPGAALLRLQLPGRKRYIEQALHIEAANTASSAP